MAPGSHKAATLGVAAAVLATVLAAAVPASGQLGGTDLIKWPQLLPPLEVPNDAADHGVVIARHGIDREPIGARRDGFGVVK
jgi:hypothetical protein